jgi:cytochrome c oxidase subunit 3
MGSNNTYKENEAKKGKTYKMLLVFAMISIVMVFAGLTSAFVVSKSRPDWLKDFTLPTVFFYSTATLMLSSVTFWMAKRMVKKGNNSGGMIFLLVTLALGLLFIVLQFKGFNELYEQGLVPVGETGSVTISFLYAFVVMHIAHLSGGLISLLIVIYNHFKQKYSPSQILGIELSAIYWHFMDFIWVYLFLFFYFYK